MILTGASVVCSLSSNVYKYNTLPPLPAQRNLTPPPTLYPQQPMSTSENYNLPRFTMTGSPDFGNTKSKRTDINVWFVGNVSQEYVKLSSDQRGQSKRNWEVYCVGSFAWDVPTFLLGLFHQVFCTYGLYWLITETKEWWFFHGGWKFEQKEYIVIFVENLEREREFVHG